MRANHNHTERRQSEQLVVSNVSKILKWEQITTSKPFLPTRFSCFQCFKDTKMRANHNNFQRCITVFCVVSNVSKILKWEQITTRCSHSFGLSSCFQCFKDTKMRANHNRLRLIYLLFLVVSNVSKILKWEQITTGFGWYTYSSSLFPMFQRY